MIPSDERRHPARQTWRNVGRLAIVSVVFGVCFVMLSRAIGDRSPWLGLLAMFYLLGLAKVAEPLVRLRMPRGLRNVARDSLANHTARRIGVRGFGNLLRRTPLRHLNASVYLASGARSLAELRDQAESAEAIHFWAAIVFTPYIAYVGSRGLVAEAVLFAAIQVVVNVYPILHLRLVRARLDGVAHKQRATRQIAAVRSPDSR